VSVLVVAVLVIVLTPAQVSVLVVALSMTVLGTLM
jgi:hypothetical protein